MKALLAVLMVLAIVAPGTPAAAYVVGVTTSIPVASTTDDEQLTTAIRSAIDDVLTHAIAFVPTVIAVEHARIVGDRIYLFLIIADDDGERTLERFSTDAPDTTDTPHTTDAASRRI